MIESFLISKVRVKILKLYLLDQHSELHVRDIVRKTDEEINAVRRELINLEKAGLFTKEQRFNRVYYILNKNYPLFFELRAMIYKEFGLGGSIIKEINNLGGVMFAVLGSNYINNNPMNPNELDLLIIGENVVMERVSIIVKTIELDNGREINYGVLTPAEFETQRKKIGGFIKTFIEKSKVFLIGSEDNFLS